MVSLVKLTSSQGIFTVSPLASQLVCQTQLIDGGGKGNYRAPFLEHADKEVQSAFCWSLGSRIIPDI